MSGSEVRASLEAQRSQALDQMVEEPDRTRRKVMRQMVFALEAAIASLPSDQSQTQYGHHKRVRDAIEAYLRNVGRPMSMDLVIEGLIEGGFRRKPADQQNPTEQDILTHTRTRIRKSIAFHLINQRGIDAEVMKEVNGKVGLWEWPDERFK